MAINSFGDFRRALKSTPNDFYLVHYSCQSLFDDNEGLSPRITSIAVSHFSSEQTVSFSTHAIAEELHIQKDAVHQRFDEIEKELLRRFYDFVRDRRGQYWVHWNMRNLTFGFEHLEHRARTLGIDSPPVVPVELRINLNDMLHRRYGANYAGHPRLSSLMLKNGGLPRHFLNGEQEVEAFKNGEFIRMHNSTLSKVGFFHASIQRTLSSKLNTNSRGVGVMLDRLFESRLVKAIGVIGTIVGVVLSVCSLI